MRRAVRQGRGRVLAAGLSLVALEVHAQPTAPSTTRSPEVPAPSTTRSLEVLAQLTAPTTTRSPEVHAQPTTRSLEVHAQPTAPSTTRSPAVPLEVGPAPTAAPLPTPTYQPTIGPPELPAGPPTPPTTPAGTTPGSPAGPTTPPGSASPSTGSTSATTLMRPPAATRPDRNPRAGARLSAAALLYGPPQGLGLAVEYLPHWVAGFAVGVGGSARLINNTTPLAAGTVHAEINLMPVPFMVTPLIGAGFGFTFGPLAEFLPGLAGKAPDRDQYVRLMPYVRFGVRVDLRRRWFLVGDFVLVPDNRVEQGSGLHPIPGLRIGFNLL